MFIVPTRILAHIPSLKFFMDIRLEEMTLEPGQVVQKAVRLRNDAELVVGRNYPYRSTLEYRAGSSEVISHCSGSIRVESTVAEITPQQPADMV